jgi:hypothetical protein
LSRFKGSKTNIFFETNLDETKQAERLFLMEGKMATITVNGAVTVTGDVTINGNVQSNTELTGNMVAGDLLATKTGYADDADTKITGSMTNRGAVSTDISAKATEVTIAAGYHNGSGVVKIAAAEQAKIIEGNIKNGITILGQAGNANVVDTTESSAPIATGTVLVDKVGFVNGAKVTGLMANKADNNVEVTTVAGTTIPAGYYNGSGSAVLSAAESAKVIAGNIKDGVTLLGVEGNLAGGTDTSDATATAAGIVAPLTAYGAAGTKLTGTLIKNPTVDPLVIAPNTVFYPMDLMGQFQGNFTCDLANLPSDCKYICYLGGDSVGSLSVVPNSVIYIKINVNCDIDGIYTPNATINYIDLTGTNMSAADTDATLIALNTNTTVVGTILTAGNRTATSNTAVTALLTAGWTVDSETL